MTDQPQRLRVAVVDIDSGFLQVLGKRMERAGWEMRVLGDAVPADELVGLRVHAVVVNLAALGSRAWDFLGELCGELPGVGVVVCTGQSSVAQRVRGLRLGADDWVTKPCHGPEEVIARVEAVVRRRRAAGAPGGSEPVRHGELTIRADHFQAYAGERSLDLTRREFELLQLLAAAEGRVLQREDVYQRVRGYAMARGDRSVDVFVRKLRQKLERASPSWTYIHTHFGVGYRFAAEPAAGASPPEAPAAGAPLPEAAAPAPAAGASQPDRSAAPSASPPDARAARPAAAPLGVS
ncbi:MAG TPA: response regulator transcription factor [Solirubrobacteraceae bacterium]|jgi:DNA-binding response OmpR family regulator|nr:response regulator transcription factor [Solirubrobacteraceae bacterium]